MLLEIACDAIVAVDQNGLIVLVNARVEQMFGFTREELVGRPVEDLLPADARPRHVVSRSVYIADPKPRRLEVKRRGGRAFPVEITLNTLATESGLLVVAAIREIGERKRREAQSERLATIVPYSQESIIAVSPDGLVTDWNAGAERMYGYSALEAIGMPISATHASSEQDELLREVLTRVREGEVVADLEMTRKTRDGRLIEVALTVLPIRDERGEVVAVASVGRDATARKRAEETVAMLARMVASSRDAINLVTLGGVITFWSAGSQAMSGYSSDQALGRHVSMLMSSPDQRAEFDAILASVADGQGVDDLETTRRRKDGRVIHVSLSAWPVHDGDGRVVGAATIAREITERKHAEATLNEARALRKRVDAMSSVLDGAPIGMVLARPCGRFERVNKAMCELLGYSEEQLLGMTFAEVTHPDDLAANTAMHESAWAGELRSGSVHKRYLHRDGRTIWAGVSWSAIGAEGQLPAFLISQIQDITAERAAAEARAQLAAVVESSSDAIITTTLDGTILTWNAGAQRIYGYSAQHAIGANGAMLAAGPAEREQQLRLVERILPERQWSRSRRAGAPNAEP